MVKGRAKRKRVRYVRDPLHGKNEVLSELEKLYGMKPEAAFAEPKVSRAQYNMGRRTVLMKCKDALRVGLASEARANTIWETVNTRMTSIENSVLVLGGYNRELLRQINELKERRRWGFWR